ncbi:MAG: hypothetical protein IT257_12545 [Chitinophagaceae bacterium]|nr:hypothetical protein [Chitinophagaceae bacterium]
MKSNPEQIPAEIFDAMSTRSFAELPADMKQSVLKYLTAEEYDELHASNRQLQQLLSAGKQGPAGKAALMQMYEEHYPENESSIRFNPALIWKAAAVLLCLSTLWFVLKKEPEVISSQHSVIVKYDTVIVEKQLPVIAEMHDTIFVVRQNLQQTDKAVKRTMPESTDGSSESNAEALTSTYATVPQDENTVPVMPLSSLNHIQNKSKRNSMQDDSLERNFKFVSM